jgi:endonuclease YncB( thermonuclease family)
MSVLTAMVLCLTPVATDGDTFRCSNLEGSFRMAGIDAPDKTCVRRKVENCSISGSKGDWIVSRDALERMFWRGKVELIYYRKDPYRRQIVTVCVRGRNVNAKMVAEGYAEAKPLWTGKGLTAKCKGQRL